MPTATCLIFRSMWGGKGKTRELTELALLTALVIGGKEAMNVLPNINPVTLLLLLGTIVYGKKALYVAMTFSLVEIGLYGMGMWAVNYLYVWPLLVLAALPFRASRSRLFWAAFAGLFGLCFGALCAIPYLFIGGVEMAFGYWISGIPFDLAHCAGNAALNFVLLLPLSDLVENIRSKQPQP